MAVTGYVFAITQEVVKDRQHGFALIGFKDTQDEAIAKAKEQVYLHAVTDPSTVAPDEDKVVFRVEGHSEAFPTAQLIFRVRHMTVAEALNKILAQAKR